MRAVSTVTTGTARADEGEESAGRAASTPIFWLTDDQLGVAPRMEALVPNTRRTWVPIKVFGISYMDLVTLRP